jgi:hypothetical protein
MIALPAPLVLRRQLEAKAGLRRRKLRRFSAAVATSREKATARQDQAIRQNAIAAPANRCRKRRVRIAPPEAQAIFRRRRHQARRPPLAKIRAGQSGTDDGTGSAKPSAGMK